MNQPMDEAQLDATYTALANAITRFEAGKAELFLATLALSLLANLPDQKTALTLISDAEALTQ
jgi:hypothetical protein